MNRNLSFFEFAVERQAKSQRFFRLVMLMMALPLAALGQASYATPYTFTTLAGQAGIPGTNDGTGIAALLALGGGTLGGRSGGNSASFELTAVQGLPGFVTRRPIGCAWAGPKDAADRMVTACGACPSRRFIFTP
jgi:hypothetical protein